MKDENYYVIHGWMLNKLHLKGAELNVYAIIYGFTQDGETEFKGSRKYLSDFTGLTTKTIDNALQALVEQKLLIKNTNRINGVVFNSYMTNVNFESVEKISTPLEKISTPLEKISTNKEIYKEIYKEDIKENKEKSADEAKFEELGFSPQLVDKVRDWLDYKKQKRQSYQPIGLKVLFDRLKKDKLEHNEQYVIDEIDYSMANNYQGIYAPKVNNNQQRAPSNFSTRRKYTPEEMKAIDDSMWTNSHIAEHLDELMKEL